VSRYKSAHYTQDMNMTLAFAMNTRKLNDDFSVPVTLAASACVIVSFLTFSSHVSKLRMGWQRRNHHRRA